MVLNKFFGSLQCLPKAPLFWYHLQCYNCQILTFLEYQDHICKDRSWLFSTFIKVLKEKNAMQVGIKVCNKSVYKGLSLLFTRVFLNPANSIYFTYSLFKNSRHAFQDITISENYLSLSIWIFMFKLCIASDFLLLSVIAP